MSAPIPAANSPGASTTLAAPPPIPAASSSKNAPASGEISRVAMAAKLPAAPITMMACSGASRLIRCTISTAMPAPMRTSGASGPSTAPKHKVASAAMKMPGRSIAFTVPAGLSPSAGL